MVQLRDEHNSFHQLYQSNKTHYDTLDIDGDKVEVAKQVLQELMKQVDDDNAEIIATGLATKFKIDISQLKTCQ